MKTIGTCKECKWWKDSHEINPVSLVGKSGVCLNHSIFNAQFSSMGDFGCIYWEAKDKPEYKYPTKTKQDLEIEDLKRENEAAFQRILELSNFLVSLGYDPTAKDKS